MAYSRAHVQDGLTQGKHNLPLHGHVIQFRKYERGLKNPEGCGHSQKVILKWYTSIDGYRNNLFLYQNPTKILLNQTKIEQKKNNIGKNKFIDPANKWTWAFNLGRHGVRLESRQVGLGFAVNLFVSSSSIWSSVCHRFDLALGSLIWAFGSSVRDRERERND
jgi:hypothetical protein